MTTMEQTSVTTQIHRVYIRATPQAIWDAITQPEWTEKYGYGGRGEFDLRPGGSYRALTSAEMRAHGAPDVAIEGEVLEADPPRRLVYTFCMVMGPELAQEGFTRVAWDIEEGEGGVTRLTVTHELEGAPKTARLMSGALEDQGAGGGWSFVLSDLKSVLETGRKMAG